MDKEECRGHVPRFEQLEVVYREAGKLFAMELNPMELKLSNDAPPPEDIAVTTYHPPPIHSINSDTGKPRTILQNMLGAATCKAFSGYQNYCDSKSDSKLKTASCDVKVIDPRQLHIARKGNKYSTEIQPDSLTSLMTYSSHYQADTGSKPFKSLINGDDPIFPQLSESMDSGCTWNSSDQGLFQSPVIKIPCRIHHHTRLDADSKNGECNVEKDSDAYLKRMYDNRTWNMYRRITAARQKKKEVAPHQPQQIISHEIVEGNNNSTMNHPSSQLIHGFGYPITMYSSSQQGSPCQDHFEDCDLPFGELEE